jgi:hypothetical protein
MGKMIGWALLRWIPWVIAAIAAFQTVAFFRAQIDTQHELNAAMQGVKANVIRAHELTGETAAALAPLATTADTLERMNQGLTATVADLKTINATMGRVLTRQEAILAAVDSLNGRMGTVVADLGAVDTKNKDLLNVTAALRVQTAGQAGKLDQLASLTNDSIGQLSRLNAKFGFLSQF